MSGVVTQIYLILLLLNVFMTKNGIRAKNHHDFDEKTLKIYKNDLTLDEGGERLDFWKPERKNSELRKSSRKKGSELGKKANQSDHKGLDLNPPDRIATDGTASGSANANVASNDTKRSRFGLHEGQRVRFSRSKNGGRHGDKDISSTRIAPMQLMQQDPEYPKNTTEQQKYHNKDDNEDPFLLSPYAIEEQFTKLLHGFEDAEFSTEVLGRTASYIDIVLFKITKIGGSFFRAREDQFVENEEKERKILFIVHALSPMGLEHLFTLTLESYLQKLLGYYLEHLDKFDIYLIPIANPDGYLNVKISNIWNKNVAPNADCPGVNVDRNFDVSWNSTQRVSSCSQHYPGGAPFSEPESRAVRDVFHRMSHKIVAYFHVHCGTYTMDTYKGDAVLYPKGYSDHQSDDDKYVDLRGEIDEAIKNANFKVLSVTVDTLHSWYGKVSGTSVDYAATVYGIPYAMELVMQLYVDAYKTPFNKMVFKQNDQATAQEAALEQIWKRVINVTFTNIYNKIEGTENK